MADYEDDGTAIDVVMPWVDGSDPAQREAFARWRPIQPWLRPRPYRYRDNGELRYSLRSIHRHMPWVRTIHLVTNGQTPAWLDVDHPRIHLVRHADFFRDRAHLPTFSSSAIEANLAWIGRAGVAQRFVLFNDDVFVGQPAMRENFVAADGGQIFNMLPWRLPRPRLWADLHYHRLVFTGALLSCTFGRKRWADMPHEPRIFDCRDLAWLDRKFGFWLRRTSRHRFRHRSDVLMGLLYIHAIAERDAGRPGGAQRVARPASHHGFVPVRDSDDLSGALAALLDAPPPFFCLNDEIENDARAAVRAREIQEALATMFPDPAPFER